MTLSVFAGLSTTAFAADGVTVSIVSFLRGEQSDLRSSELLEARVSGYDGNVRDLTSQGKVTASATGNWIFKIEGTNAKSAKVTPTVHIKPLKAAGAAGNTNKVFFGSANGYTDCTCYFDDVKDADAFLQKVITNLPANISNPHVVKTKADSNGYFIVGTEYGDCAIAARNLNEALTEETKITEATDGNKPYDKEAYLTDCLKYYN